MLFAAVIITEGCKKSSTDSTGTSIVPGAPSAFGLTIPANGATGVPFAPTFAWENASGETNYTLQVSADAAFTVPLKYENTAIAANTTSFTLPGGLLAAGTAYYWRVIAVNTVGVTTATGAPFSFTTASSGVWSTASNPSSSFDEILGMARDSSSLYLVGYDSKAGYLGWRIEKRNISDGTLVSAFGIAGVISGVTTTKSVAQAVAADSTYLYVVGYEMISGVRKWRIEKRTLANGSLVTAFGDGFSGVSTSGSTTTNSVANSIAIDSANMYIAGYDTIPGGSRQWRVEKRSLSSGSLDTAFDADGIVLSNPSANDDVAYGIAVDANNVYVVGSDETAGLGSPAWRIETFSSATGTSVAVVSESASGYGGRAYAIAVDASSMYVVGYDTQVATTNTQWRIEKRNLADSQLVAAFGTSGVIQENPTASDDDAHAIALDATYLYVAGYDSGASFGGEQWRLEKRLLTDGSLATSFGTGGIIKSNGSPDLNEPWAIVVDDSHIYCAGYDTPTLDDDQWRIEKQAK